MLVNLVSFAAALALAAADGSDRPADAKPYRGSLGAPPPAGSLFLYPERIPLPGGSFADADRGMLFVPANRADAKSAVIAIEIYRFRALEGATESIAGGAPPIFQLNGGPGFRGLESRMADNADFYDEDIRPFVEIADLVVVGQRGIGSSKPDTICESWGGIFGLAKCKAFWEGKGLDLTGLSVVEAAADVRDVALALGYDDGITLSGNSFGSHWAMAVMRFYPEIVRRAVLSGMEGPDHTYDMPGWVLNSLRRMAAAAEASPGLTGYIPEGGLIAALEAVIARAEEARLTVTVDDPETGKPREFSFGPSDVRRMAMGYSGRVSSRRGMPSWPADILALYRGDYARAALATLRRMGERGGGGGFRTASFWMLDCGSGISRARLAQLEADPSAAIVGNLGGFYQSSCPIWQADLGEEFRENFATDIPTVIVHGTWDVNTPYENALELLPHFANGKHVPVVGGSHGALGEALDHSETFRQALATFMRNGDTSGLPDQVQLPPVEWEVPAD